LSAEVTIPASPDHEYWTDIRVNDLLFRAQIDTGMTQPACEIGLGLAPADFDRVRPSLRQIELVEHDIGEESQTTVAGIGRVRIDSLDGSEIETRIARLHSNLLGVCFFHRLPGFEVHWDLASRAMTIRRIV
jgi:predicted aspartyl protease